VEQDITSSVKKVHLISLGCARNRADSEVMLGSVLAKGWQVTPEIEDANVIVVNTCGFIGPAKQESIDTILAAAEYKKTNPELSLVVSGCLTQRYKSQLAKGLPEVDYFIGTDEFPKLSSILAKASTEKRVYASRTNYLYDGELPKLNTLSKSSAYVKVAEGCQHNCAFCIIPAIRGPLRSRPIASVVKEVEKLVSEGVMEINLIAQDLAAYGRDQNSGENLLTLLRALVAIDGLCWVRLLYVYPEHIDDEFLAFFANEEKIVKYLDVPVQHASDRVLKNMNRNLSREELVTVFSKLREKVPGVAIRTSVMVGFPGETDEDFNQLHEFVAEQRFDHLGCFSYSQEEGTVAGRMPDQIDEEVKTKRLAKIMELQQEISRDLQEQKVGKTFDVLIEGPSEESELLYKGRLSTQAPEVDGWVYLNDGPVESHSLKRVRITEAHDYDLVGTVLEPH